MVFLDTVGLVALWDEADQWHVRARDAFVEMRRTRMNGVSTDLVLFECGNSAARRPYRHEVNQLRRRLQHGGKLFAPTELEFEEAWEAYDRGDGGGAGIVDHVSFVIMRRLGINKAFTSDVHFQAAGFETLF